MSKVSRSSLLDCLKKVLSGTSRKEILEQSDALIFQGEEVITFNGEVLFRHTSPVNLNAVVPARVLVRLLDKMPDDEIDVSQQGGELRIKGVHRSAGIACPVDVLLPYKEVPQPKTWSKIPEGVVRHLLHAASVCGVDPSQPLTTVVHITPKMVESCDNYRLYRATLATGFPQEVLIHYGGVQALEGMNPLEVSIESGWTHFKTKEGVVSVICSHGTYHECIDQILNMEAKDEVLLPQTLPEMLDRAGTMAEGVGPAVTKYDSNVDVTIRDGMLILASRKAVGWYRERKRIRYDGPPLQFSVNPAFLSDVLHKTHKVMIGGGRMRVEEGESIFVVCLQDPSTQQDASEPEEETVE